LAAPATIRHASAGIVWSLTTPPVAHGENTSHSVEMAASAGTTSAPSSAAAAVDRR
jgi:hypothetical protein